MHLQIGGNLRTVHNDQLVYSNRQDIQSTLFTGFKIWLVHNCNTGEDHLNIKISTALLLYNACTLLNMMKRVSRTIINLKNTSEGWQLFLQKIIVCGGRIF